MAFFFTIVTLRVVSAMQYCIFEVREVFRGKIFKGIVRHRAEYYGNLEVATSSYQNTGVTSVKFNWPGFPV